MKKFIPQDLEELKRLIKAHQVYNDKMEDLIRRKKALLKKAQDILNKKSLEKTRRQINSLIR